jgi:hypothetical protein
MGRARAWFLVAAAAALSVAPGNPASMGAVARGARFGPASIGRWSPPVDVGLVGIHAALLKTGDVLLWMFPSDQPGSEARLIDPVTGDNTDVSIGVRRDIFCAGQSILPDGRVLVTGGMRYGSTGDDGTRNVTIFDPATSTWSKAQSMKRPRWYPTNVQMPDGSTLVFGGQRTDGQTIREVESYDPATGAWTELPRSAEKLMALYSKFVVLPNGLLFRAGDDEDTHLFHPDTSSWSFVDVMNFGYRDGGGVVLLPGLQRVLTAGGRRDRTGATRTAEDIDFSHPSPNWTYTSPMHHGRFELNLVLLADGTALAVGGAKGPGLYDRPVRIAELYDPTKDVWTDMAAQTAQRTYHSTALLLPDGRVVSAGSDLGSLQSTVEYFSPPYLFRGPRPSITSAPSTLGYGQTFTISTPDASAITRVALVRPGAATHANDFDQRYVDLSFTAGSGSVMATAPADANMAPPGYYMLFILNSKGVPAIAPFVVLA